MLNFDQLWNFFLTLLFSTFLNFTQLCSIFFNCVQHCAAMHKFYAFFFSSRLHIFGEVIFIFFISWKFRSSIFNKYLSKILAVHVIALCVHACSHQQKFNYVILCVGLFLLLWECLILCWLKYSQRIWICWGQVVRAATDKYTDSFTPARDHLLQRSSLRWIRESVWT